MPTSNERAKLPPVRSHRDLVVWQKAIDLSLECYRVADLLPSTERFGLKAQMQRASTSIPANIAEGNKREGTLDYIRFLGNSRGSNAELDTYFEIARRLDYVSSHDLTTAYDLSEEVDKMLVALQRALRRKVKPNSDRVD